ncbi:cytochrome P450 78A7-like [Fagus crenata]
MEFGLFITKDTSWWVLTLPAFLGSKNLLDCYVLFAIFMAFVSLSLLTWAFASGGIAWKNGRNQRGPVSIRGPRGLPIFGSLFTLSRGLAHRSLAAMAWSRATTTQLMAFSLGSTPVVVASDPHTAREILTSPHFADRPIKQSAKSLMFSRAIGFAPNGTYWRLLRKIASSHLFAPRRILAHESKRQLECAAMLKNIANEQKINGVVSLRKHLQGASLNNIMGSVFGKRYYPASDREELEELKDMVNEGFELLGAFNWSDYLPWLSYFYDPFRIKERCAKLVPRVRKLVKNIIEEHRVSESKRVSDNGDFVDVLLSLDGDEKLQEDDMVAVLWNYAFLIPSEYGSPTKYLCQVANSETCLHELIRVHGTLTFHNHTFIMRGTTLFDRQLVRPYDLWDPTVSPPQGTGPAVAYTMRITCLYSLA